MARQNSPSRAGRDDRDGRARDGGRSSGRARSPLNEARKDYRSDRHRPSTGNSRSYESRRDRSRDRHRSGRERSRSRDRARHGDRRDYRRHSPSQYGRLSRSRSPPPARRYGRSRSRSPRRRDDRASRRSPRDRDRDRDDKKNDSRPSTRDSRDARPSTRDSADSRPQSANLSDRNYSSTQSTVKTPAEEHGVPVEKRKKSLRENLTRHLAEHSDPSNHPATDSKVDTKSKQTKRPVESKKRKMLDGDFRPPPVVARASTDATNDAAIQKASKEKNAAELDKAKAEAFLANDEEVEVKKLKIRKLEDEAPPLPQQHDDEMDDDEDMLSDDFDGDMNEQVFKPRQSNASAEESNLSRIKKAGTMDVDKKPDDGEEEDSLDAFMRDLTAKPPPAVGLSRNPNSTNPRDEVKASFELEEDDGMTAVDTEDLLATAQAKAKSTKKKLPPVDHKKIEYITFKKDFYREPQEVKNMDETEVARLRNQLDKISVGGRDPPKPVLRWSYFGFSMAMLNILDNQRKFKQPTPIQAQGIPTILSGRDVIGIAKTGSGKTLAYLLPMFRHIMDQPPLRERDGPIGFIMVPTRELAVQVQNECKIWCKVNGLKSVAVYGGAPLTDQIAAVKGRPHIVIATPGRWIEMLTANGGRLVNHQRTTYVVLDEADRLFDGGFQPQVMKILEQIRPDRQLVIFSATFPKIIEGAALKYLRMPVRITVSGIGVVAPEITQIVEIHEESKKMRELLRLFGKFELDEENKALVFVERQEACDEAVRTLRARGYLAISVHGGKEQIDRQDAIRQFMDGTFTVLVATSVAARGLDVRDLKLVVNFDPPNHLEDYVHRAGRTGRAGNTGTAVTFISPDEGRYAASIMTALKASGQEVPEALQKVHEKHVESIKSGNIKKEDHKVYDGFIEGNKGLGALDHRRNQAQREEQKYWRKEFKELGGEEPEEEKEDKKSDDKEKVKKNGDEPMDYFTSLMHKVDQTDVTIKKLANSEAQQPKLTAKERAELAGGAINARLRQGGSIRGTAPIDNKGPDAGAFHATLEVNDFPQKARWGVTNRSNVVKILERTGASITNKGTYYGPGEPRPTGPNEQPPLYILVEGDTEVQVKQAMNELKEMLKAGIQADAEAEARALTAGAVSTSRYKVT